MSLNKLGRYDVIRVLGKGAMGLVYEARDPNLDRRVAIKTIKVENLSEEAAVEYEARFRTEARSAARLQHPNIVSVYDSDRHGDMAYLVMEFIQGEDLKHHLDGGKRYSLEQTLTMMRELLSALDYAHRQSIVHRDIKPANLLIEADGRLKLTDFGVARIQDSGEVTRTQGSMVGTLKYMSPEQVQGQPVDARSDLFAVGIVLYQLLTGKRPFDGDTDFAIIQQIVGHVPAAPSSVNTQLPPAVDAVVARALTKKRDLRYASAQEFARALQEASGQAADPTIVPPASQPGRHAGNATDTGVQRSRAGGSTVRISSSGTDTGSTVTQELELVYWKDIRDSDDLEDLEVFLDKFPSGIYADLARRRVKRLTGSATADDSGTGSVTAVMAAVPQPPTDWTRLQSLNLGEPAGVSKPVGNADAGDSDVTRMATGAGPVTDSTATAVPAMPPEPAQGTAPVAAQTMTQAETEATPLSAAPAAPVALPGRFSKKMPVFALVGVAVLVAAGVAFKLSAGGAAAPADVAAPAAVSGTSGAATAPPSAAPALPTAAQKAAATAPAAALPAASRPASKRIAAASGPAEKPPLPRPVPGRPAGAENASVATPEPAAVSAGATNPKQACENRILLGFQICMNEQCARPAFSGHPVCVERRAMDKLRQEAREMRN